jgi:outer membrane protein OmpA-like peptidoglycan-associated protein
MGNRSRLFASAAFPLLSLSLMFQPAGAALLQQGTVNAVAARQVADTGSFEVAQQAAPDAGETEQELLKKKKAEEGKAQPEQKPEKHEPAAEQKPAAEPEAPKAPKQEAPKQEAPKQEAPKAEAPKPAPAAEPEAAPKPKAAEPPAAQPEAQPEAKKPHKQPAEEPAQPEAAPKPKAAAEPQAAPAEPAPAAAPEGKPKKHQKPAEQSDAPAPAPEAAPKPKAAAEQPAAAEAPAPAAEPAAPAQPDGQPKKHHKPAEPAQPEAPAAAAPAAPAQPAEKPAHKQPAEEVVPGTEKPPAPKVEGTKEPQAEQPAATPGAEKPAAPKTQAEGQPAAPVTPGEKPVAPKQPDAAKAPAAPTDATNPAAPANVPAPAANAAQQAAPASTGGETVSPQELERRKKIAENPTAAGAGTGPVILPVQNGAAVLDSDKDAARRGHHQRNGQGGQDQGQQVPGQPAQAGQPVAPAGQVGQGQAQGNQRPPAPANVRAPTSDADAQRVPGGNQAAPVRIDAITRDQGRRMDQRPNFDAPDGARIEDRQDNRVIINFGDDVYVRHDDTQRFTRDGERPSYEQLSRDRYRETIDRPDGDRIVTVRNRYGDIIQRSRIDARGREYVLFYSPELENQPNQDDYYRDPGDDLPPMRLRIPLNQYIIDTSEDQNQDYYDFLRKPPVEPVERVYSLNEVRYSARIRDKVRRIDLDTITFATGSADIPMAQAKTLRGIADAIGKVVKNDPTETFLIEGHTDAVGSDQSNLILSDQRAESVANVLSDVYGIPPENLATQGYGEQYLKVQTDGPEQENRRVTIRRVTALVRPVASK